MSMASIVELIKQEMEISQLMTKLGPDIKATVRGFEEKCAKINLNYQETCRT